MLRIYKDNPTADAQDGTAVSTLGDYSAPVHFGLDARNDDEQVQTLALRCDFGYRTRGTVTVGTTTDENDRYQLSIDGTNWADAITFTEQIEDANVIFYVKARTISADYSMTDRSVKFVLDYYLEWA